MTIETTAMTVQQRAAVALGSSKAETELVELAAKSKSIIAISNKDGRQECHAAAMVAKDARINIEKAGKAAREDATAFSRAVIAEEKRLVDLIQPEENRLIDLRDKFDAKVKAEKEAAEAAERDRIASIKDKIELIKRSPMNAAMLDADGAQALLDMTEEGEIDDSFGEFRGEALEAKADACEQLRAMVASKVAAEATAARIKAEQEAEAVRLEQERQRLAAERAEQERIDAQRRAERAEQERQLQAQRDEIARQQKIIDDQRAEQDRIRKAEQDRADREAAAKIESERKEQDRIAAEQEKQQAAQAQPVPQQNTQQPASEAGMPAGVRQVVAAPVAAQVQSVATPQTNGDTARDTAWKIAGVVSEMTEQERVLVLHYCNRLIKQRQEAA